MPTLHHTHTQSSSDAVASQNGNYKQILSNAVDAGYDTVVITEHGHCGTYIDICKDNKKLDKPLKILYGCEVYLASTDNEIDHLVLVAENEEFRQTLYRIYQAGQDANFLQGNNADLRMFKQIFYK